MPAQPNFSDNFFSDLDLVCPRTNHDGIPPSFFTDLEFAWLNALSREPSVSVADLESLATDLKNWRNHYRNLLSHFLAQLPKDDPLVSPISLFGTMDIGRLETAHTRALAWLLGDNEHGFGTKLLQVLLDHLLENREIRLTHLTRVESEFPVYCGSRRAGAARIDILASGVWQESGKEQSWLLAIEAKIDSGEGEGQLAQYDDWLDEHPKSTEIIRVFLTPDDRAPMTASAEWQILSFATLAGIFRGVPDLADKHGYHFLRYYLTGLLKDVCGLPVPIAPDCANPYVAVDYLKSAFGVSKGEKPDVQPR